MKYTWSNSAPNRLGPVNFELGVIAGNKTTNFLLSRLIPEVNDGKVSVAGMKDFTVIMRTRLSCVGKES